jgi:hypothetical protein
MRLRTVVTVAVVCAGALGCPGVVPPPVLEGTTPPSPSNVDLVLVFGTARPQSVVRIYASADCTGTALGQGAAVDGSGVFSVPVAVQRNTTVVFRATATVGSGEPSACSDGLTFIQDSTPPQVTVTGTTPGSPANQNAPEVVGRTEPGSRVRVFNTVLCTGSPIAEGAADSSGNFRVRISVPDNSSTSLYVSATDPAGNLSACTFPAVTYQEDSAAPAPPALLSTSPPSPSNLDLPVVLGSGEIGALVRIFSGAGCSGTALAQAQVQADGYFTVAVRVPPDATTTLSANAEDAAGNRSACSTGTLTYTEDSTPPAAPTVETVNPPSPSPISMVTFGGTAEVSSTVEVFANPSCGPPSLGSTIALGSGAFSITATVPSNATTTLYFQAIDGVGNRSSCGAAAVQFTHDNTPPAITWIGDGPRSSGGPDGGWPSELDYQRQTDVLAAHWDATDLGAGIVRYEYSAGASCPGNVVAPRDVALQTSISTSGLTLAEGLYVSCVRAFDGAGNTSGWTSSDGVRVDVTPPAVASVSPANGEQEVALGRSITIQFTEPVDSATVSGSTVRLLRGTAPVSAGVAAGYDSVALYPSASLERSATYTVDLQAGITDLVGNPLPPSSTTFTAARFAFEVEQEIEASTSDVFDARVAAGADGSALAIWSIRQGTTGPFEVWAARAAPGGSFGSPILLSGTMPYVPALAVSMEQGGAGWVAWNEQTSPMPQFSLMARRFEPASGWQSPMVITSVGTTYSANLAEGGGHHVLTWNDDVPRQMVSRWSAGSGWTVPVQLGTGYGTPRAAVDAAGRAVAVWAQSDTIRASRSAAGAPWDAPTIVDAPSGYAAYGPNVGIASTGAAMVGWRRYHYSTFQESDVMFSRAAWGESFTAPAPIATPSPSANGPKSLDLAVAGDGSALAVWNQDGAGINTNFYSSWWSGASWSPPALATSGVAGSLALALDGNGRFIAAHIRSNPFDSFQYVFNRYLPVFGWSPDWEQVATGSLQAGWWTPDPIVRLAGVGDGRAFLLHTHMTGSVMSAFSQAYR